MAEGMKVTRLPETKKIGKYTFKILLKKEGTPYIVKEHIVAYTTTWANAKGKLLNKHRVNPDEKPALYAMYISTVAVPPEERKVGISKMSGKMEGVGSISTNTTLNKGCLNRRCAKSKGEPTICSNCYSMASLVGKKGSPPRATAIAMLTRNTTLLTKAPLQNIPTIKTEFFRFSAEGDLHNEQHLLNYFAIARHNPKTRFSIWTKQHGIVSSVLKHTRKPANLFFIQSSLQVNTPEPLKPGYTKVFTVYTPKFIEDHNIKINCGAKSCMSCKLCYTTNKTVFVSEQLKGKGFKVGKTP